MSHFTTIKTQIKDIDALRSAVQEMGLSLLQKTTAWGYYQNNIKGDYVIRLKGPYDVAVNKEKDGTFTLTCDWWDGHVEKEVGQNYGKLLQLYGVHKAIREAKRKGHLVQRRQQENGAIKLIIPERCGKRVQKKSQCDRRGHRSRLWNFLCGISRVGARSIVRA